MSKSRSRRKVAKRASAELEFERRLFGSFYYAIPHKVRRAMIEAVLSSDAEENLCRVAFTCQGKPYFARMFSLTLGLVHALRFIEEVRRLKSAQLPPNHQRP